MLEVVKDACLLQEHVYHEVAVVHKTQRASSRPSTESGPPAPASFSWRSTSSLIVRTWRGLAPLVTTKASVSPSSFSTPSTSVSRPSFEEAALAANANGPALCQQRSLLKWHHCPPKLQEHWGRRSRRLHLTKERMARRNGGEARLALVAEPLQPEQDHGHDEGNEQDEAAQ